MRTVNDIIERFGGATALAGSLGCSPSNIREWRRLGIPARWHHQLVEMAVRRGRMKWCTHKLLASLASGKGAAAPIATVKDFGMPKRARANDASASGKARPKRPGPQAAA